MNFLIQIVPTGQTSTLKDCPPGYFIYNNELCFKAREVSYFNNRIQAFLPDGAEVAEDLENEDFHALPVESAKYFITAVTKQDQRALNWANDLVDTDEERAIANALADGLPAYPINPPEKTWEFKLVLKKEDSEKTLNQFFTEDYIKTFIVEQFSNWPDDVRQAMATWFLTS